MTLRRGISLALAVVALISYGATRLSTTTTVQPLSSANVSGTLSLIIEPDGGIQPILNLITSASSSIDLVMYELEDANVEHALAAAESRGVVVRVLLNEGYYGKKENNKNDAAYQYLSEHGVSVHWTPAYFALTHQKTLSIDDNRALIMTMNLTPQYYASGREFGIIDADIHDVAAIESTFTNDWNNENVAASNGDTLIWSPGSENALLTLINNAHTSLDIYNEEMADKKVVAALAAAAQRGVAVRVDMTYSKNWATAFATLTHAGVSVRTYAANAPLYIHAKMILADATRAFVGSENFSTNSLEKNRELGLIIADPATLSLLSSTFERDWSGATPVVPQG